MAPLGVRRLLLRLGGCGGAVYRVVVVGGGGGGREFLKIGYEPSSLTAPRSPKTRRYLPLRLAHHTKSHSTQPRLQGKNSLHMAVWYH